jgi:sortase A
MATPRPQIALPGALRRPFRPRLSRRASGFLGGLALLIGLVLLADAVLTVIWGDPFSAVFTQREQKKLSKQLDAADQATLPLGTLQLVRGAGSEQDRMAVLGAHERGSTRAGDPIGRLSIPRIHSKYVFVAGTGEESLKKGPGHYAGAAFPGEHGTVAIAGHRTTYAAPFRHLDKLRRGDVITIGMGYGFFTYRVEGQRTVQPTNITVLRPKRYDRLVLTTCTPLFSAAKRLVVSAKLVKADPRGPAIHLVPVPPKAPSFTARPQR